MINWIRGWAVWCKVTGHRRGKWVHVHPSMTIGKEIVTFRCPRCRGEWFKERKVKTKEAK